jgi:hypothetical protein
VKDRTSTFIQNIRSPEFNRVFCLYYADRAFVVYESILAVAVALTRKIIGWCVRGIA